jgi:hypothetical protein
MMIGPGAPNRIVMDTLETRRLPSIIAAGGVVLLVAGTISPLAAQPAASRPAPVSRPASGPATDAGELVRALNSPRWPEREEAAWGLISMGPAAYGPLRDAFRGQPLYEFRRQVRRVVREIYLTEQLGPPRAFLGISHDRRVLSSTEDARIMPGHTGLQITHVFNGLPAQRAGVRPGDLFVGLNGRAGTADHPALAFTTWIGGQKPGTRCRLSLYRGGEGLRAEEGRTGGFRPAEFAKLALRPVERRLDPRIPEGAAGLTIVNPAGVGRGLGLRTGDLLVALDDQLLPAADPVGALREWARLHGRGSGGGGEAGQPDRPASAQFLRGGRLLEIEATLGRRPANLGAQPSEIWNAEPQRIEQAEADFAAWWEATFDPDRRYVEEADDDRRWRLESDSDSQL